MEDQATRYSHLCVRDAVAQARREVPKSSPLGVHASGQWTKKIRGRRVYFGSIREVEIEAAEAAYFEHEAAVRGGRDPIAATPDTITVAEVFDQYAARLLERVEAGDEVSPHSYTTTVQRLVMAKAALGPQAVVASLKPGDFSRAKTAMKKPAKTRPNGYSAHSIGNAIRVSRMVFKWAFEEEELIAGIPRYGAAWDPPKRKTLRREAEGRGFDGARRFTPEQIHKLLEHASPLLKASILLGLNGGFTSSEIAALEPRHIDFEAGWYEGLRPKTGVDRRVPLWPATIDAVQAARVADGGASEPLFRTPDGELLYWNTVERSTEGEPAKSRGNDYLKNAFRNLLIQSKVRVRAADAPGVGFRTFRTTFSSVADAAGDEKAKCRMNGHITDARMEGRYVDRDSIEDDRLRHVANHVHEWLFGEPVGEWKA